MCLHPQIEQMTVNNTGTLHMLFVEQCFQTGVPTGSSLMSVQTDNTFVHIDITRVYSVITHI